MVEIAEDLDQIKQPELKWDYQRFMGFTRSYDSKRDVLFAFEEPKRPAVSIDVAEGAWIRFDPDTEAVVGIEIQDFEGLFLKRHPELAKGWDMVKPRITKKLRRADESSTLADYLRFLLTKLQEWLNSDAQTPPTPPTRRTKPA